MRKTYSVRCPQGHEFDIELLDGDMAALRDGKALTTACPVCGVCVTLPSLYGGAEVRVEGVNAEAVAAVFADILTELHRTATAEYQGPIDESGPGPSVQPEAVEPANSPMRIAGSNRPTRGRDRPQLSSPAARPRMFTAGGLCADSPLEPSENEFFVAHEASLEKSADLRRSLEIGLADTDLRPYIPDQDIRPGHILCKIAAKIQTTAFCVFDLPESQNRNVYLELGIAIGLGRPFVLIKSDKSQIPSLVEGLNYFGFASYTGLRQELGQRVQVGQFSTILPQESVPATDTYFVADGEFEQEDFREAIRIALRNYPLQPEYLTGGQVGPQLALTRLVCTIQAARFGVYRIDEDASGNTFLALGIAIGLSKPWLLIARKGTAVPQDVRGLSNFDFSSFTQLEADFANRCADFLKQHAGDTPAQHGGGRDKGLLPRNHVRKHKASVLVIGHSLGVDAECVEWDSPEPNVADYDVVIMDMTTTEKSLPPVWAYSVQKRSQVDWSQYLLWPRIRDSVERLLVSGGTLFIITRPDMVIHPLTPADSAGSLQTIAPLPLLPYGERISGKSIKWVSPDFGFYFRHIEGWDFHLTGELLDNFLQAVALEARPIATNRAGEALALLVSIRTSTKTGKAGRAFFLPPPSRVESAEAVRLLLAHLDDLCQSADEDEKEAAALRPVHQAATMEPGGVPSTELRTVRILHISDIHRGPTAPTSNATLLGKLLDDIRYAYDEDNARLGSNEPQLGPPDLVVISGDLTQHAEEAEYEVALRFLEELLPLVNSDRRRVVLVPGNHDVNWTIAAQSYSPSTKEEYEHQVPRGEPFGQSVKRAPDGTFWRKNEASYTDRMKPFKAFFDAFYQGVHIYSLTRESAFTVYDFSESIGLVAVGYNTCDEIDAYPRGGKPASLDRRAFINTDSIYHAEQSAAFHVDQRGLLRVAVFHHNIRSVNHGEDFLEPKYLQILKRHGFDMCLHGHVHVASQDLFDATQARVLPLIGAGSLAAPYVDRPPAAPMGYNIVVIDRESGGVCVHTRRHDENNLVWAADYQWEGKPYYVVRRSGGR